jgi:hypothetical protein
MEEVLKEGEAQLKVGVPPVKPEGGAEGGFSGGTLGGAGTFHRWFKSFYVELRWGATHFSSSPPGGGRGERVGVATAKLLSAFGFFRRPLIPPLSPSFAASIQP